MVDRYAHRSRFALPCLFLALLAKPLFAGELADLARCRAVIDRDERLACYDQLSERDASGAMATSPGPAAPGQPSPDVPTTARRDPELRWSIADDDVHRLRPHRPNYVILRQSSRPNDQPFRTSNEFLTPAPATTPVHLDHNEMKFQVSVKAALARDVLLGGDLWFGYTQQSNWQLWNGDVSRPFRETNYEPEFMLAHALNARLGDAWTLRNLTWGVNHQSNGRGEPLSRSWNRVYAQLDFERGQDLEVLVRPWWRIRTNRSHDDNPDIERYLGYGDVVISYRAPTWIASLLLRNNLERRNNRGAMQLDLAFPCLNLGDFLLKMQLFSGYGESLIDYNHRQTTIGVGVEATGWMDRTFSRGSKPAACSRRTSSW